ncbi:hypothetical protein TI39_contig4317g00001 [Zymoseptoria brevis]|uniref:Uncharacterized protein n=1 Tax=Zymoseptoria brevis TaxID=1047168 RepID=A0A0F4G8X5_9PEZI|nr:hypothetical protein TI39_contig4317g00001 [Zymoseptoria brevis]
MATALKEAHLMTIAELDEAISKLTSELEPHRATWKREMQDLQEQEKPNELEISHWRNVRSSDELRERCGISHAKASKQLQIARAEVEELEKKREVLSSENEGFMTLDTYLKGLKRGRDRKDGLRE